MKMSESCSEKARLFVTWVLAIIHILCNSGNSMEGGRQGRPCTSPLAGQVWLAPAEHLFQPNQWYPGLRPVSQAQRGSVCTSSSQYSPCTWLSYPSRPWGPAHSCCVLVHGKWDVVRVGIIRKGNRAAQGLGARGEVQGGKEVQDAVVGHVDRRVQCWEMESTLGPGQAVSPEMGPGTHGTPYPELKPLFGDCLRPEP